VSRVIAEGNEPSLWTGTPAGGNAQEDPALSTPAGATAAHEARFLDPKMRSDSSPAATVEKASGRIRAMRFGERRAIDLQLPITIRPRAREGDRMTFTSPVASAPLP